MQNKTQFKQHSYPAYFSIEYLVELREYGPLYSSWASSEQELQEPLDGVAGCVGNCCSALEELTEDMSDEFLPVLREYVLYIESMKVGCLSDFLCVAFCVMVVVVVVLFWGCVRVNGLSTVFEEQPDSN